MTWKVLEPLVQADPSAIRSAVRGVTEAWGPKARRQAVQELALALGDQRATFVLRLLNETIAPARRLGLELLPGMTGINANIRRNSREPLRDRRLPHATRLAATKALLRGLDPTGKGAALMLRAYVAGLGRKRILERLDEVAKEFDNPPAMEMVRAELRTLEKLRCPRCGSLRRRKNMAEHLWNRHQMLLVGHRARTANQALDERLAMQPPAAALVEFHRDLLGKGLHDEEAITQLRREAAERHESVCPHCFAFVPVAEPPALQPAETAPGRISANGCAVALSEIAGRARLHIQSDSRVIFDGPDPEASDVPASCRRWAMVCAAVGLVAAAALPVPWHLVTALAAVVVSLALLALASQRSKNPHDPLARAMDLAWQRLIPALPPGDAVARLALASIDRGNPNIRSAALTKAIDDAEQAATLGAVFANALSPLWWLQFADDRDDPTPTLVARFRRCIEGELPLSAAAGLLEHWRRDRPGRADRARMRAMLCEQACESGLGVWDIVELGRAYPPLGSALVTDDVDGLARLCFVWEQRLIRPWQPCGPAATVFELARNAELSAQILETASDLLLYHRLPALGDDPPEALLLCGRGMVYREAVLYEPPGEVRVRTCEEWRGGGYEVRLGPHRLRFTDPPGPIVERLKAWSNFFLGEFLPRAEGVLKYRASDRLSVLLSPVVGRCPACAKAVIPLAGQIGVTASGVK
jgi:uncharacterized C2H2 Zn-finger protein